MSKEHDVHHKGAITAPRARTVYDRAEKVLDALEAGSIDTEQARARNGALRNMGSYIKTELEHAKMTGRLAPGSAALPGFRRTEAQDVPPSEAVSRLPRRAAAVG